MEFLIGLFLLILIIVAVFLIVDATQHTANSAKQIAQQVTKLRFIMESYYVVIGTNLMSIQKPCKGCLQKGETVQMIMDYDCLICPKCGNKRAY
jgi:hypothetical protein